MIDPVQSPQSPVQLPTEVPQTPDPEQAAQDLLEVGSQWGTDDYDARVRAFGEAIQEGDADYRQALVAEILRQDPNAFNSWMSPTRINAQVDAGQVSQSARGDMAEAIAAAYNAGQIPSQDIVGPDGEVIGTSSALDTYLHNPDSTSTDGVDQQVEHARNMREFAEFFGGPHYSSDISSFRETYSQHLITDYALNDQLEDGALRDNAAGLAAIVLTGDPTRGDIAADVLAGLDQGQLQSLMERVARAGDSISPNHLEGLVEHSTVAYRDGLTAADISIPDLFSSLVAQVSRVDTAESREAAAMLARVPASSGDIFSDRHTGNVQERVDAMGLLFVSHSEPMLESLTDFDTTRIGSKDDADVKQYMQDASDLGALFNVVLFDGDQTYQGSARAAVLEYAEGLKSQINTAEGDADAMGRLSMLMGGADDAITQGFNELKAREDAQTEMVSFIADLALAGIPVGDKAKDAVSGMIGELFSSPQVTEALKGVSGSIIDSTTGYLTDEAKQALTGALGEDETELLDQQGASNALREALLTGISNERDLAAIENYAEDVSQGINLWRK
ncbi:hypothetical protein [Luteimonas kalidii]|uniref:DUF1217 domain-containing protein n=1 Tax=Luteimonas kalidii TaxID=3042025 RepID=A0ABT6JRY4_9GAMM|nr:hypothetical protein [Luteimonas kalidii]MDH5833449.1 hypothetical protein [Luteimonas kalidii]